MQRPVLTNMSDKVLDIMSEKGVAVTSSSASSSSSAAPPSNAPTATSDKPLTRASAKAASRAKGSDIIKKSANALVGIGKIMANCEYTDLQEMLFQLCSPLLKEHRSAIQMFKTREGTLECYKNMAAGDWIKPLWGAVDKMRLWANFKNVVGLITSFSTSMKLTLIPGSPQVLIEDRLCATMWNFLSNLLSERAGSCGYLSEHYPGPLADMLGDKASQIASMKRFEHHWTVYCEAKKITAPDIVDLCTRSSLNTSAMEQFGRLCKRARWKVTPEVLERIRVYFGGVMQEDIVEDSLGKVRDTEYRDASSRTLRLFKAYEVPVRRKQLKMWGRDEIETLPEVPQEATSGNHDDVFEPRVREDMDLKGVMSTDAANRWQTFTLTTLRGVPGEMALLSHLHDNGKNFEKMGEAWRASVLPRHAFLIHRKDDNCAEAFYSLESSTSAVLGWRFCSKHVVLSHCERPKWRVVFDLDKHFVLPFVVTSPVSAFLSNVPLEEVCINATTARPMPVICRLLSFRHAMDSHECQSPV